MKEKIKEVQDYFKKKLLSGQFKVTEISEHLLHITIDGNYTFCIWVGNPNLPNTRDQHSTDCDNNFIHLNLNQKERITLHSRTKKIVSKYRKDVLVKEKRNKIKKLERELKAELG